MFTNYLRALRKRFFGTIGCLLGHKWVVGFLLSLAGKILFWLAKLLIIVLLSNVGLSIPSL